MKPDKLSQCDRQHCYLSSHFITYLQGDHYLLFQSRCRQGRIQDFFQVWAPNDELVLECY